jgi:hypothetical protein
MATFKRFGTIHTFKDEFIRGMLAKKYERNFPKRCFSRIQGFGIYGFPESHAASFALLVYCPAWLKCHYPDVFAAAMLNGQPLGFYAPERRSHRLAVAGRYRQVVSRGKILRCEGILQRKAMSSMWLATAFPVAWRCFNISSLQRRMRSPGSGQCDDLAHGSDRRRKDKKCHSKWIDT